MCNSYNQKYAYVHDWGARAFSLMQCCSAQLYVSYAIDNIDIIILKPLRLLYF